MAGITLTFSSLTPEEAQRLLSFFNGETEEDLLQKVEMKIEGEGISKKGTFICPHCEFVNSAPNLLLAPRENLVSVLCSSCSTQLLI